MKQKTHNRLLVHIVLPLLVCILLTSVLTGSLMAADYSAEVLADDPIAYWRFEDTGTTALEAIAGRNGTYQNVTHGVSSAYPGLGTAAQFNGTDSTVSVPSLIGSYGSISIEAWVRPDSLPSNGWAALYNTDSGMVPAHWQLLNNRFEWALGFSDLNNTYTFAPGNWYHIVTTYNVTSGIGLLYVNGQLQETLFTGEFRNTTFGSGHIGSWLGDRRFFHGFIDELAVYASALTPEQIASHYDTASQSQDSSALVAWWPQDGSANDMVGGNHPIATNNLNFVAGKIGSGLTVYPGGYNEIPDRPNLQNQQFTVSAWVRPDGPGPNDDANKIIGKEFAPPQGNNAGSLGLWWSSQNNRFSFAVGPLSNTILSTSEFPAGTFYHVAGTYDGTKLRLYVNGQLEAERSLVFTIPYEPAVPWTIGSTHSYYRNIGFPRTWNGVIDDVKLFNKPLSAQEISNEFQGFVAWWPEDGDANDANGDHHPSATNAISFVPGKIGGGASLGTGGYIEITDSVDLQNQQFSIAAWVRPDGAGPNNDTFGSTIVHKATSPSLYGTEFNSTGTWWSGLDHRFRFSIGSLSNAIASTNPFPPGQFYHVAGTYDGVYLRLYVNGQLEAESNVSITIPYDPTVPWMIGSLYSYYRELEGCLGSACSAVSAVIFCAYVPNGT